MQKFFSIFHRLNIQTRLVVYYTTFAVLTLGTVIFFTYNQAAQSLQATVEDKLNTVAELKRNSLNQWVDEQQRNAVFLSNLPELRSLSGGFLNSERSLEERIMARRELTDLLRLLPNAPLIFRIFRSALMGVWSLHDPCPCRYVSEDQSFFQKVPIGHSRRRFIILICLAAQYFDCYAAIG
jgi:hypothetical protein